VRSVVNWLRSPGPSPFRHWKGSDTQHLFNRINVLWASTLVPDLLSAEQQRSIVDAVRSAQQDDGGWTMARFADWKRIDNTSLEGDSDGYATGLATFVLQAAGVSRDDAAVRRGRAWLTSHQQSGGSWWTASLNKQRDPQSDPGKFMSDAATAYAVLALTR
jgi:squalene-hopene/tetraprenyl-beta-curcumene cyclase